MSSILVINGKTIVIDGDGSSVSVRDGNVIVNGKVVESGLSGIVAIRWEGPAASIDATGDVTCGPVAGDVRAGMGVTVQGHVGGNVRAGMSVTCGDVRGSCTAGMSVTRR